MSVEPLTRGKSLPSVRRAIVETLMSIGIEEGEAEAECDIMVEYVTGLRPSQQLFARTVLDEEQLSKLDSVLAARARRVPIQYILEEAYFYGLKMKVRPGVFIPRPDTEALVEVVLAKFASMFANENIKALEIGVGSGAICVSLLSKTERLNFLGVDVSTEALAVTRENAVAHNVDSRLVLQCEEKWFTLGRKFNALISNPPYIPRRDQKELQPEVGLHEPEAALFGFDEDGLGYYRQIAVHAKDVLCPPALIAVEVGDGQADAVRGLFLQANFKDVTEHSDLNGLARVVAARLE